MAIELRWIEWGSKEYEAMVDFRDANLRRPLGLVLDRSNLEVERDALLLAAFDGDRCVASTVMSLESPGLARMRAVAVDPELRGSGLGRRMVQEFERRALEEGIGEVFLHAREVAIPFYLAMGYETVGEPFVEVTVPHVAMRKSLR